MTTATAPASKPRRGIKLKSGDTVTQFPTHPVSSHLMRVVSLDAIVVDARLQFRVDGLDHDYVKDLAQVYADKAGEIPPITVFEFCGVLTLADGFHRHCAMIAAGLSETRAIVLQGDRQAAMRCALQANGSHGKRRTLADAVYAYRRAIAESLVEPGDAPAVAALLGISDRWAREITKEARDRANAERDATIRRLAEEGQSVRKIAEELGVPKSTVSDAVRKRKTSESGQSKPVPDLPVTDGQREGVYVLLDTGMSFSEISQDLSIPESIVAALAKSRAMDPDKAASLDFQAPAPLLDLQPSAPDAESVALQAAKRAYLALRGPDLARFRDWVALQGKGASS